MERGLQGAIVDVSPNGKARRSTIWTRQGPGSRPGGRFRRAHFSRRPSQVSHDAAHLAGVAVAGRGERHAIASPDEQLGSQKPFQQANVPALRARPAARTPRTGSSRAGRPLRMPGASSAAEAAHRTRVSEPGGALGKLSQTKFVTGHGQSRGAATSVRIDWNCRQDGWNSTIRSPEIETARRARGIGRCSGWRCSTGPGP